MPRFLRKPFTRRLCWGLLAGVLLAGVSATGHAQAPSAKPKAVIKTDSLTTYDGWSIPITYYQSPAGKDAAVVILLHGEGENQLVWKDKTGLATKLHAADFAVITCDLRKHGQAKNARSEGNKTLDSADYKAMANPARKGELEAIQEFLFEEHQAGRLNMAKTGILAVDNMVPIALTWAYGDWLKKPYQDAPSPAAMTPRGQTVRALALISPSEMVSGVTSTPALRWFRLNTGKAVSILFLNSEDDGSNRDLKNMVKQVSSSKNKDAVFSESFKGKFKGTDLLARVPNAELLVVGYFKKQLQDVDVPWRDRRSRLNR